MKYLSDLIQITDFVTTFSFFDHCYSVFGELIDLLALLNAAVNFALYGCMSHQFRETFKRVFIRCQNNDDASRMTSTYLMVS